MLYSSSFYINVTKGCYKGQNVKNVDYENYDYNKKKLSVTITNMRQQITRIYKHFKNTNLNIALKTNNFLERNKLMKKTVCTKCKTMSPMLCTALLIAARSMQLPWGHFCG